MRPPSANHQRRRFAPMSANGASVGLMSTSTAGPAMTLPTAAAASAHMTGFPCITITSVGGHAAHRAMNGHDHDAGRRCHRLHTIIAAGMAHQRAAGRNVNGTRSKSASGG